MRLEGINSGHVGIHSRVERRYKCHSCGKTFSETSGTPLYGLKTPLWIVAVQPMQLDIAQAALYGLKTPLWIVALVLALLSHGCPLQAIVFAFGIDERTVKAWQTKAGQHARRV